MDSSSTETSGEKYKCHVDSCNKSYTSRESCMVHERVHKKDGLYVCSSHGCNEEFETFRALSAHFNEHVTNEEKPFTCTEVGCTSNFAQRGRLVHHLKAIHYSATRLYECVDVGCNKSYESIEQYKHHQTHDHSRSVCDLIGCADAFVNDATKEKHRGEHETNAPLSVSDSVIRAQVTIIVDKPSLTNAQGSPSQQPTIVTSSETKAAEEEAAKAAAIAEARRLFPCPYENCNKRLTSERTLAEHVRIHSGDRPLRCDVGECQKTFTHSSSLSAHKRTHNDDNPTVYKYDCTITGCDKAFKSKREMQDHVRVHTGETPFKCDYPGCLKSFKQTGHLIRHKRIHANTRPFACSVCNRSYTQAVTTRTHIEAKHPGMNAIVVDKITKKPVPYKKRPLSENQKKPSSAPVRPNRPTVARKRTSTAAQTGVQIIGKRARVVDIEESSDESDDDDADVHMVDGSAIEVRVVAEE